MSDNDDSKTDGTRRFKDDADAQQHLASTLKLSDVTIDGYDAIFYPRGRTWPKTATASA